jgi:hypothetical protein
MSNNSATTLLFCGKSLMNQVLDNLFEVINDNLFCSEVLSLMSTSHSVRKLILREDVVSVVSRPAVRRSLTTTLRYHRVSNWRSCFTWMSRYRFSIGCLLFDNPEQVVTYFKHILREFSSSSISVIPVRIFYQGERVSAPLIAILDDEVLRRDRVFCRCAEDCFSSLYESNPLYNCHRMGMVEMGTDQISLSKICVAIVSSTRNFRLLRTSSLHTVYFCGGIRTIERGSCARQTSLISVVFPKDLTNIGDHAFAHCISLSTVVLPQCLTSIGDHAFSDCTSLSTVVLPESLPDAHLFQRWSFLGA